MTDILTKEKRSWNMSRIKGANTRPEVQVRSLLHKNGFRFRINVKNLPGKPDIVLPKYNTVIFIHGCFWHRHKNCKFAFTPKSRVDFWDNKFRENQFRDKIATRQLKSLKWKVIVLWECQIKKNVNIIISKLTQKLADSK